MYSRDLITYENSAPPLPEKLSSNRSSPYFRSLTDHPTSIKKTSCKSLNPPKTILTNCILPEIGNKELRSLKLNGQVNHLAVIRTTSLKDSKSSIKPAPLDLNLTYNPPADFLRSKFQGKKRSMLSRVFSLDNPPKSPANNFFPDSKDQETDPIYIQPSNTDKSNPVFLKELKRTKTVSTHPLKENSLISERDSPYPSFNREKFNLDIDSINSQDNPINPKKSLSRTKSLTNCLVSPLKRMASLDKSQPKTQLIRKDSLGMKLKLGTCYVDD